MPTVLDSLVITLGLDPSQFTKGQRDAAEAFLKTKEESLRTAKEMEAAGKRAASFFSELRANVIGLFAAFTAGKGLREFVEDMTRGDAATGRFARQLGISTELLSAWQGAAERTGGSAQGVTASMAGLTDELEQYKLGMPPGQAIQFFNSLHISLRQSNGAWKTASDLYLELADRLRGIDPRRAAAIMRSIGADPGMVNLMLMGGDALRRLLAEMQRVAAVTPRDAAAAAARQDAWTKLARTSEELGRTLLTAVTPAILAFTRALQALEEFLEQHPDILGTLATGIAALATVLSLGLIGRVGAFFTAITGGATGALAAVSRLYGVVVALVAAVGGLQALHDLQPTPEEADAIRKRMGVTDPEWDAIRKRQRELFGPPGGAPDRKPDLLDWLGIGSGYRTDADGADEHEKFIRAEAAKRGIDPDVAAQVASSEGLGRGPGDAGSSFGDFQMHVGGIAPGGNAARGLGDDFRRDTGLDPRDPANWRAMDMYALDYAKEHGWGLQHGWKGLPFTGIGAAPGAPSAAQVSGAGTVNNSSTSTDVRIGNLNVHSAAQDAGGIAGDIGAAVRRASFANQVNSGIN